MIWALLALLGIPIWLIVVLLAGVLANRKRFLGRPEVFRFVERSGDRFARRPG